MRENVVQAALRHKVIAIARGVAPEQSLPLARALYAGGIRLLELTFAQKEPESFRQTAASIARLRQEFGEEMFMGAGTVLTVEQAELAHEAGAQFIVSPDVNADVIRRTVELGMASFPGAMTPTEVMTAHRAGADLVKLFPVARLGAAYVKDLVAPISHVPLLAVGGVNVDNAAEFLKAGCVGVGVGGQLVNKEKIAAGDWAGITETARRMMAAVEQG